MDFLNRLYTAASAARSAFLAPLKGSSEIGKRPTPENEVRYAHRVMWVDPDVRAAILDMRKMDREDGRVKRIHGKTAMDTVRGGLVLTVSGTNKTLLREWEIFEHRLALNNIQKLKSDARNLLMQGALPLQWVFDKEMNVIEAVAMPAETIVADVEVTGRFKDPAKAYYQLDVMTGAKIAEFALYRLSMARLDPESYDDMGAPGRPFLDASRACWKKLTMTEEDLVIRRRSRAHLRLAHVLEGAKPQELTDYKKQVERDQFEITTDYYLNRKGGVTAVQGDAQMGEIKDVVHLLETFFAGSPLPKALLGYTEGLNRDILEDLKRTYYDEIDVVQDTLAAVYKVGWHIHLLFRGINPDAEDFELKFAERRTETLQQTTDRALKMHVLGIPYGMLWEELGYNPQYVLERRAAEAKSKEAYPQPGGDVQEGVDKPNITVTPGNARKGESATDVGT